MFSQSVSARKTMIFTVTLIVSISVATAAGGRPFDMCGLQKNTVVEEFKLSTLYPMFGEILTTESNDNIYVVSICQPVPKMFYDPRKMSGAIKLTPKGNMVDLGHIDQSNVIVNENSIVLTYVGGDRDRDVEDTCKGLRWTTYLTFLCDPTAIHDILTLIDEDPDQPEICQVWFTVRTSKICNRQPYLPLVVMEKDFSTLKNQTDHEKYSVRESTNSNEIPSRKNEFDYETNNINKNNKSLNIENKEKPNINDFYNEFNKSFSNKHLSTRTENKIINDKIKNGTQIISKDQKKQSDNENKDKYLNKYKETVNAKNEKEESKGSNSKTNTPEDKMSVVHENNKLWIKKNNTVPGIPPKKEYSYPDKNETISHYNDLKKYLNQNKNSEGKYENSVLRESTEYDENKDGNLNHEFPEDVSNNDMKYKKPIGNESMEKNSRRNTFENQTSNKEMNDFSDNKKPSDNEKKSNRDNSKESNLNNDARTYNRIPSMGNRIKYNTANEEKIVVTKDNQSQSKDSKSIIYDNKVPGDVTKENIANQTHSKNNNSESKSFPKEEQKNEIENHPKNVNSSITDSTPRADSTTENKPTGSGDKGVNANTFNTTKHTTNVDTNQTNSQNNNSESKSFPKEEQKNEIENHPKNVNSSITDSTPRADSTTENKPTGSGDKGVNANTFNTTKHTTNDDTNQTNSQNNNSESKSFQKEDQKNEIVNNPKNVNSSTTESTPRADSTTKNKPTGSGDKGVDANTFNTTKHTTNDDTNQTNSQNNNSKSKSFQKEDQKNEIVNNPKNVNSSITESTPRADSTTENRPTGSGDKDVDANTNNTTKPNTNDGNPTIDANENNTMKNNNNSTSGKDDNTIADTTITSPSNTMVNDYTNESSEVNGSSTESPVDGSLNNMKTNNESEPNGTIINEANNVNKNLQPDQSIPVPSAHSSDNDERDNLKTNTDSTNQSGNGFSFDNLFSNIFPNGIHVSTTTIIGILASLTAVTGLVGTAINRYYYKLTGTDQIPFKGTIQWIYNSIKAIILSFCCCCRRGGYDDLEAPDLTNEKTPLLQPKFNIPTPLLVDETSQKSSDSGDTADSSKQNSSNEYGSMSKEKKSLASQKKYRKIKRKSKISDTNLSSPESLVTNVEEKLLNIENNLHGKSIKEVISGKINTTFTEKVKPTINSIIKKVGKNIESTEDEIKKDLDKISKDAALISKFVENEKSTKITDDVPVDGEIKSENNSEKTHLNENETQNVVVQEDIKSITLGESQQSPNVKPLSEVIVSQVSVPDLQQIKRNEQAPDMKTSTVDRVVTEKLIESTRNKKDIDVKNNTENILETVVTSPIDTKTSINESKLKFLGFEKEDKNVQKVVTDESIATDKKIENEEDDVEVIEEIIYIDGSDGDEGEEEIIEEIIETTTIEDSPDTLDESIPGSGKTKVTVRTTRKISSSSLPGEVKTIEETVVTDVLPENEERQSGFQFGVGKSGISMSVGDKKMEIGKSGLNFTRSKSKSPKNVEGDEPDKRDTKSPEKSKKSISLPKIFKRSISQPADDDIQEAEDESASTKKLHRTGSGFLKLGKSRSKSTLVLKTGDVTMDADAMSNFMDNERNASRISNVGLGELDLKVGDEGVAVAAVVRKTSTTTSGGKDRPVTTETVVDISPVDLGFGLDRDRQSTINAETKSKAKTKREKKDKPNLTTMTRPF